MKDGMGRHLYNRVFLYFMGVLAPITELEDTINVQITIY